MVLGNGGSMFCLKYLIGCSTGAWDVHIKNVLGDQLHSVIGILI